MKLVQRVAAAVLLSLPGASVALADDGPHQFSSPALMVEDSALIPLREVCEWLGATVSWLQGNVGVDLADRHLELRPESAAVEIKGEQVALSPAPRLIGQSLYVPARGVLEGLGVVVQWRDEGPHLILVHCGREAASAHVLLYGRSQYVKASN